jgi:hypothetical protein
MSTRPSGGGLRRTRTRRTFSLEDADNREQAARFVELAKGLTPVQWREIQRAYDNPSTLGANVYERLPESAFDFKALADEFHMTYSTAPTWIKGGSVEYSPGLQALNRALSAVAYRVKDTDPKDFIAAYAPFLPFIPLHSFGIEGDLADLSEPAAHGPLVAQFERVVEASTGRVVLPQSMLPDSQERIAIAICFAAALNPKRQDALANELAQLAAFVPDADAAYALTHGAAGTVPDPRAKAILDGIQARKLALTAWAGVKDREATENAALIMAAVIIAGWILSAVGYWLVTHQTTADPGTILRAAGWGVLIVLGAGAVLGFVLLLWDLLPLPGKGWMKR